MTSGSALHDLVFHVNVEPGLRPLGVGFAASALIAGAVLIAYGWRGVRNIRFDQRYVEGTLRIVFSVAGLAGLTTGALLGF